MKNKLIAKTLGLIALAGVSITSPVAHANDWQDDDNRNSGYNQPQEEWNNFPIQQLREGFRFSKMINDRQDQQLDEILAGVSNNSLSKSMFIRLMQEQKNIRAQERGYMSDRFMNELEFRKLSRSLDGAERNLRMAPQSDRHQRYSQRPWAGF